MAKDIFEAVHELKHQFAIEGLKVEMIKLNGRLYIDAGQVETIDGVKITDTIYENDATHWLAIKPKKD